MKHIFLFLLFCSIAFNQSYQQIESNNSIKHYIITSETIRNAGLTRLSDILILVDDWNVYSIDGFTYYASANALSTFQRQTWDVMLDGQRMDINIFDTKNLNILPLSIDQIDYVEIISVPHIHEGEFSERGLVHIHSKRPESTFSFQSNYQMGNETRDPGPYKYTEFVTPNVDKIGPDISIKTSFNGKQFYASLNLLNQILNATDALVVQRNNSISHYHPKLEMIGRSVKVGFNREKVNFELFIIHSFFKDFLFFKPYGREIPTKHSFSHSGIRGRFFIGKRSDVRYQLKYSVNRLNKRDNTLDLDFDWRLNNIYSFVESNFRHSLYRAKLGVGLERFWVNFEKPWERNYLQIGKVYTEIDFAFSENTHQTISAMAVFSGGEIVTKSLLSNTWKIGSKETLKSLLSFSQRLFQEDNNLWYWTENGYRFLTEIGVSYDVLSKIKKSNQLTYDILWKYQLNNASSFEIGSSFRFFDNLYLERQEYHINSEDNSFFSPQPVQIHTGVSGKVLRGQITFDSHPIASIANHLSYYYQISWSRDNHFIDIWKSFP